MPVATLAPVKIAGVTVQHASLHNTHHVKTLGLRIGDSVLVERRGDVIPQVTRVLLPDRPPGARVWQPPKTCSACRTKLVLRSTGTADGAGVSPSGKKKAPAGVEMLMCPNERCPARQGRLLRHFARTCVKGLGDKTVDTLVAQGLVSAPTDLYTLKDKQEQVQAHCLQLLRPGLRSVR